MSTRPSPIRKTIAASTALGMLVSKPVRNSTTMSTTSDIVMFASWVRPLLLVEDLGLGRAAVDDEGAGEAGGEVGAGEPDDVAVHVHALVVLHREAARRRRALGDDQDEAGERDRR